MRYFINKRSFNSLNIVLSWTLTVTDTEKIFSDKCMITKKMNDDESFVDNENQEEDEVLEDPLQLEHVEDEDRDDDDAVSEKNTSKRRTKIQKQKEWYKGGEKTEVWCCHLCIQVGRIRECQCLCSRFRVNQSSLALYLKSGKGFVGGGKQSIVLTTDEEKRIVQFVTDRVNLGVGLDFDQLKSVIQELLIELTAPWRACGWCILVRDGVNRRRSLRRLSHLMAWLGSGDSRKVRKVTSTVKSSLMFCEIWPTVILRKIPDNTPPEEVNEPDCPEERPEGW